MTKTNTIHKRNTTNLKISTTLLQHQPQSTQPLYGGGSPGNLQGAILNEIRGMKKSLLFSLVLYTIRTVVYTYIISCYRKCLKTGCLVPGVDFIELKSWTCFILHIQKPSRGGFHKPIYALHQAFKLYAKLLHLKKGE